MQNIAVVPGTATNFMPRLFTYAPSFVSGSVLLAGVAGEGGAGRATGTAGPAGDALPLSCDVCTVVKPSGAGVISSCAGFFPLFKKKNPAPPTANVPPAAGTSHGLPGGGV